MPKPLKVFGYTGYRMKALTKRNAHGQTDEVIAAASKAEAHRKSGLARSAFDRTVHEVIKPQEVAMAMASPGTVFWRPLNPFARTGDEWFAIAPEEAQ